MRWCYRLVLLAYLVLAGLYSFITPLWEAPDEPSHFVYVEQMLDHGTPPAPTGTQPDFFWLTDYAISGYEWHQPPTYYAVAASLLAVNRRLNLLPVHTTFPAVSPTFPGEGQPLFVRQPRQPEEAYLLRAFSVLCGLLTVIVTHALARRIFPAESGLPELAAGIVALTPQFTFVNAYVSNDGLTLLTGSFALFAIIQTGTWARGRPGIDKPEANAGMQRLAWALAGLATGLAIIVKLLTCFLVPIGVAWLIYQAGERRRWTASGVYLAMAALGPLLIWLRWPGWMAAMLADPSGRVNLSLLNPQYILNLVPIAHASFWGVFGWVNILTAPWSRRVLDIGLLAGLGAAGIVLWRERRTLSRPQRGMLLALGATVALVLAEFLAFNLTIRQPQGRLLFPCLGALAILAAYGWVRLARRRRGAVVAGLLGTWAAINVICLVGTLLPTYW